MIQKELENHKKKIKLENKLIELLGDGNTDLNQLRTILKIPKWKVKRMIMDVCKPRELRSRKIHKFLSKIKLMKTIESLTTSAKANFQTIKELSSKLSRKTNLPPFSQTTLYRTVKAGGWKFRPVVFHSNETDTLKNARIWFFERFLPMLNDPREVVVYFDWSSFSEKNFQKKSWAKSGERAISTEIYVYAKIHLLAVLGHNEVESIQFVRGNLTSSLIFDFVSQSIESLLEKNHKRGVRLTIVLDNSPMNHSWAIKNFCLIKRVKLLYIAPNSSFLNPIEQMFAKVKSPIKQAFTMNKYDNK